MVRPLAVLLAASLVAGSCSDDDAPDVAAPDVAVTADTTDLSNVHGGADPETGGLTIPEVTGTFAVPLPSIGFGLRLPDQWQATVLTEDALEQVARARMVSPFFLDAAHTVAETGALFYAAGIDADEQVTDLKVLRIDDVEPALGSLRTLADTIAERARDAEVTEVDGVEGTFLRLDFRLEQPTVDGDETVDAHISQLFFPGADVVWSVVVTAETAASQDLVVNLLAETFVLV